MKEFWCLTFAVPHEAAPLLAEAEIRAKADFRGAKFWEVSWGGREMVLAQTGIGPERAARATLFLLEHYPLTHLLSTGYCGALLEGIAPGDAILAETLVSSQALDLSPLVSAPDLLKKAEETLNSLQIPWRRGTLVTSPKAVLKTADKERLAQKTGGMGVDMESFEVVQAPQKAGKKIASVTVRFVVDALQDQLTDTEAFLDDEARVQPARLAREILRRPKILMELPALEKKASHARAKMAQFCRRFLGVGDNR